MIRRLVVFVGADLEEESLGGNVVVAGVAGIVPIIDHGAEHGAGFPPVVAVVLGDGEETGDLSGLIAFVDGHHVVGNGCGGIFD